MKKLSTIIFALLASVVFIVPTQAATTCEDTKLDATTFLPVISCFEEKAFLPIINCPKEKASLPIFWHCTEPEEDRTSTSLEDFINSVEVRYRNGQVTIYYGSYITLVTLDCNVLLIVNRLPSEGIVRMYYNTSDGEFHIVDLVVSLGNTRLIELPHTDG